jgi:hypothetical protein
MATNQDDLERLKSLLSYGIDHNDEHEDEIKEWAELARNLGYDGAGKILEEASDKLAEVTDQLGNALEKLKE